MKVIGILKFFLLIILYLFANNLFPQDKSSEENLDWFYFRSEYRELLKQKIQLEKSLIQLKLNYEKLEKENKSLSDKVLAYEEEIITLHKDTLNYKKEVETKLKELYLTIENLKRDKLVLEAHVLELQKKQGEYLRQMSERGLLEANLTRVETERNTILERYRELQDEIEKSKKENELLTKKLQETLEKQKQTEFQLKSTETRLKELKEITENQQKHPEPKVTIENTSKIEELNKNLKELKVSKETEILDLKKKLAQLEEENLKLAQSTENSKGEALEKLKEQIRILQTEKPDI
ncbi:MAG: hypothetical protein N3A69_17520 [Leptospiraceae bacterium]|nr:hypothetical protein [Leptospiraceae bacterium]